MTSTDRQPGLAVSPRWAQWRQQVDLDDYDARWEAMDAAGERIHDEADLIASYRPASVLDAGCGTGRIAIELARRGLNVVGVDMDADMIERARSKSESVTWMQADLTDFDLGRRFDVVAMPGNVMLFCDPAMRSAVVAGCARHLAPMGHLIAGFSLERRADAITLATYDEMCRAVGLTLACRLATWDGDPFDPSDGDYAVSIHAAPEVVSR